MGATSVPANLLPRGMYTGSPAYRRTSRRRRGGEHGLAPRRAALCRTNLRVRRSGRRRACSCSDPGALRRSDQDRTEPEPHGSHRSGGTAGASRAGDLARSRQRARRPARAAGRARLLRRSGQPGQRARHLRQADGRRQSGPAHRSLQHQRDRGGAAGDHPEQAHDDRNFRAWRQQGIQVRQVLFHEFAGRVAEELLARFLPARPATAAEARARGAGRRGRRILAQRARRCAREREGIRLRRGLRAHLSAGQHRVRHRRARDAGGCSGRRLCGDAAGRHRGARARLERGPVQTEALWRRLPRPARDRDQAAARAAHQRPGQQRVLHSRRRACNSPAPTTSWRSIRSGLPASASTRSASPIRPMPTPPDKSSPRR